MMKFTQAREAYLQTKIEILQERINQTNINKRHALKRRFAKLDRTKAKLIKGVTE